MAIDELGDLDHIIHEPARLAILTVLSACDGADFLFLQSTTRLTKGNLSSHLMRLEKAGLIEINKEFVNRKSHTEALLTEAGRLGVEEHWKKLKTLRRSSKRAGASKAKPNPQATGS